ncbi:hypothetical protein A2U01_0021069, partial [Trifolium medium]|nr:hypothetical protein [Trifolium medium]
MRMLRRFVKRSLKICRVNYEVPTWGTSHMPHLFLGLILPPQ